MMRKALVLLIAVAGLANAALAATLTVQVRKYDGSAFPDAAVTVLGFPTVGTTSEPIASQSSVKRAGSDGNTVFDIQTGYKYSVFVSSQGMRPTIKQQMGDPAYMPVQTSGSDISIIRYLYPDASLTGIAGSAFVTVNDISTGTIVFGEIRNTRTNEAVAQGMGKTADGTGPVNVAFTIDNIPPADAGFYRLYVGMPEQKLSYEESNAAAVTYGEVWAMTVSSSSFCGANTVEDGAAYTASQPTFEGRVVDQNRAPLKDCVVTLKKKDPENISGWEWENPLSVSETRTDYNGYFAFYDVAVDSYAIAVGKKGYRGEFINWSVYGGNGLWPGRDRWITNNYEGYIMLQQALGKFKGYVRVRTSGGFLPVPEAYVSIWGDWNSWPSLADTDPTSRGASGETGGFGNYYTTGYQRTANCWTNVRTAMDGSFIIEGLASGNYSMNIWSEFASQGYIFSTDSFSTNPSGSGSHASDERRITVSTFTVNAGSDEYWAVNIASGTGNIFTQDAFAAPLEIYVASVTEQTGRIAGRITFDVDVSSFTISASSGIVVWAYEQTGDSGQGFQKRFFTVIQGTILNKTTDYVIDVSSGASYWIEVRSRYWGLVNSHDMNVSLSTTAALSGLDFKLAPSGLIRGVVKLPDGSIFKRRSTSYYEDRIELQARGVNTNCEGWGQVNDDGSFEITGLIPGMYNIATINERHYYDSSGAGVPLEWPNAAVNGISVRGSQETNLEIKLANGAIVLPQTPALPEISTSTPYTSYGIIMLPSGQSVTRETFGMMVKGRESFDRNVPFQYDAENQSAPWARRRILPGRRDFLLARIDRFGPGDEETAESDHFSLTFISQMKNIDIKFDPLNPNTTTYLEFESGTLGRSTIRGKVRGSRVFTQKDVDLMTTSGMDTFTNYIPSVMLYDAAGQLKGFGSALPSIERLYEWDIRINDNGFTYEWLTNELAAYPVGYRIDRLPAGDYVAVFETPNYPPLMKKVTLASGDNVLDVDFDENVIAGSGLEGVVTSTDSIPVSGATIVLTHRTVSKTLTTDENGCFSASGLPPGTYRMIINKAGYAQACEKFGLGLTPKVFDNGSEIKLTRSDCRVSGTVYSQMMPVGKVIAGARVVAYSETYNAANPGKMLPVISCVTDNEGKYALEDLVSADTYKIYVLASGRLLEWKNLSTLTPGENTGIDFVLKSLPPRLKVAMTKIYENGRFFYKFLIESPKKIINPHNPAAIAAPYCQYSPVSSPAAAFDASSAVETLPNIGPVITGSDGNASYTYSLKIPVIEDSEFYKLRIEATDGSIDYTEDILFGPKIDAKSKTDVKDQLALGGDITLDETGYDATRITVDPGSITPANEETTNENQDGVDVPIGGFLSAMPNFSMSRTGSAKASALASISEDVLAGDVYEVALGDAQLNRSLSLSFKFDTSRVADSDLTSLSVFQYNSVTGLWERVPGIVTVDAVSGLVSVDVDSLAGTSNAMPSQHKGRSLVKNGVFAINRAAATSQSGVYAVFKQDPGTVKAYAGTRFEVINFPNPFNLKSKNVTLLDTNSGFDQTIEGTLIKYSLPSDKAGHIRLYIYNLAGELVKEIDEGTKNGGYYYYTEWDGRNDGGEKCASGVYFVIAKSDGKALNSKPHKMAILK